MKIVITDLDGTLLDHNRYSFEDALPALEALRRHGAALVLCTSKTRAEVEYWRERLGIYAPFIVENGGALYVPRNYFAASVAGVRRRKGYEVVQYGTPYAELVGTLDAAALESGCRVIGFHRMGPEEISLRTHLPIDQARLAKRREYDEPFEILDQGTHSLLRAIESRGKRWIRGGRFFHITGGHDKARAVRDLTDLYRSSGGSVFTIGLGDSWNDLAFLRAVDAPILIRSGVSDLLRKEIGDCTVTALPGVPGWNAAVLRALEPATVAWGQTA